MQRVPNEEKVLERMQPGAISHEGFLGDDPRPLSDILEADERAVRRLGLSHAEIADRLREILVRARAELERPVRVGKDLEAVYREAKGGIPSPWPGEGVFPKGEVTLRDIESGETIQYTPLSVHLIAEHGFYEGRGSRYRVHPRKVADMLFEPRR